MTWTQRFKLSDIKELIKGPDFAATLEDLLPADIAEIVLLLDLEDRVTIFSHLSPDFSARVFEHLEPREQKQLLQALGPLQARQMLGEMYSDDMADFVGELHPTQAQAVLDLIPVECAQEIRDLLVYPETSAGGLMITEFLAVDEATPVAGAITAIRETAANNESIYYVYVTRDGQLVGTVSLRELILALPHAQLKDVMEHNVISVTPTTDQEDVARILSKYDFLAVPVVDEQRRIMGLVTIDDVLDVLSDEATEDIAMLGGSQPLEEPYLSVPLLALYRKRAPWLVGLALVLAMTTVIMQQFKLVLEAMVALSFFIPMLIAAGGNAGTQAATLVIRGMSVGEIENRHWSKILFNELSMGLMIGLTIAVIGFVSAIGISGSPTLALTVALSLLIVIVLAVTTGAMLPLIFRRIKVDPAVLSSPFITTMVDVFGLLIYFAVAAFFLGIVL